MSGRKYSIATLNNLKKKEIQVKSELSQTLDLFKEKLMIAREFEKSKGNRLSKTIEDLERNIANLTEWKISEFLAQDHHYNNDLEKAERKIQSQIGELNSKKAEVNTIEKNIHQLHFLCNRKSEVLNLLEEFNNRIQKCKERVQLELTPKFSNFVNSSKSSILQSFNSIETSSKYLSINFSESSDHFLNEITETEVKLAILQSKLSTLDNETTKQIATIIQIESTDEELKLELREKFQKRNESNNSSEGQIGSSLDKFKLELSEFKQKKNLLLFENTYRIIQSIEILFEKHENDINYMINSIEERLIQLRKLETKYISLKNQSDLWKIEINESLEYHIRKKENYSINVKWSFAELEKEWENTIASDFLTEGKYQDILKRILKIQEMIEIEKNLDEQSVYIRDALKISLEELGYDVDSKENEQFIKEKQLRVLEFSLSDMVRVKMEISPGGKINSNIIFKTNDSEISNSDWQEINCLVEEWESSYFQMEKNLKKYGIAMTLDFFESLTRDNLILEEFVWTNMRHVNKGNTLGKQRKNGI
jgi:hypothetical protein